jgi:hypothetical protein
MHAPHPANESERLLFRQLYETLVRVDCEGKVRPALAASWEIAADGRSWTLALREDARFADGTPLTPADVLASWSDDRAAGGLRPEVAPVVDAVTTAAGGSLLVTLRGEAADAPRALADTRLGVVRRVPGTIWPYGTTGLAVAPGATPRTDGRSVITLDTSPARPATPGAAPVASSTRFVIVPDRDPRDFLDEGIDLVVTRDPAALDYAATLPHYARVPLAWTRTRAFVSRWRDGSTPQLAPEARGALAADAVRGDARGAEGPFWWDTMPPCGIGPPPAPGSPGATATGRVVYERADRASRDLAERLVGLAAIPPARAGEILQALAPGAPGRLFQRAIGLSDAALRAAQVRGDDSGYVVSLARHPVDPCQEWRSAVERIGWLRPDAIVPLVDTRLWAVARRDRSGLVSEWDGGLLLLNAGRAR